MIILGVILVAAGALWLLAGQVPGFGRLPGDIVIEGKRTHIYFPLVSCLVLSVLLSLILWVIQRFSG